MPSFYTLTSGTTAQAQDVNQLINAFNGSAGNGIPISLTAVNDSVNFALAVKNADPTNSRSLQVLRANNNVLLQADANGVIVSPDGGATTGQVLTVNATQTVIGKTFTTPHFTGPVVDSGGLTITLGNLVMTAGSVQVPASFLQVQNGAANVAASGDVRLPTGAGHTVAWRNAGNTGDVSIQFDGTDRFQVNGIPVAGAAGAATGTYWQLNINGTTYKIALLNN